VLPKPEKDTLVAKKIPPRSHKMAQTEHAKIKIGTALKLQLFIYLQAAV